MKTGGHGGKIGKGDVRLVETDAEIIAHGGIFAQRKIEARLREGERVWYDAGT